LGGRKRRVVLVVGGFDNLANKTNGQQQEQHGPSGLLQRASHV